MSKKEELEYYKKQNESYEKMHEYYYEEGRKSNMAFDVLFEIARSEEVRELLYELKELRLKEKQWGETK